MTLAAIGIGSNVGDARGRVRAALAALERLGRVRARSALYRTRPWGAADQPAFVNAAALLDTALAPLALLRALKALERELGRTRTYRWGPRTIDLDLLAHGDAALEGRELTLPHPRLLERAFVLVPLASIDGRYAPALAALPPGSLEDVQRIRATAARIVRPVNWDETLERVRAAARFCASAGLARFKVESDDVAIEIRRTLRPAPAATNGKATLALAGDPADAGTDAGNGSKTVLKAEFVGIVRFSRPTVAAGSSIAADRELAYVESLGIRNPIRSGGPGRVADVFVRDGEPVEFGQPLFAVEPSHVS